MCFISVLLQRAELCWVDALNVTWDYYLAHKYHAKCHLFPQDTVSKHHISIIIPSIHHSLYRRNLLSRYNSCEWENDRAGNWGDKLSGDDSNTPHRRHISFNAQWNREDVPANDRSCVIAGLCMSNSLAHENVHSGSMNQCGGEILIHFNLEFPFKFSICGW